MQAQMPIWSELGRTTLYPRNIFRIEWNRFDDDLRTWIKGDLRLDNQPKFQDNPLTDPDNFISNIWLFQTNVTLPQVNIQTSEVTLPMFNFKVQSRFEFQDTFTVTFTELYQQPIRKFFNRWLLYIANYKNGTLGMQQNYKQKVDVYLGYPVNETQFEDVYKISFEGVYPTNVPELQLDYETTDVVQLTINFKYDFYEEYILSNGSLRAIGEVQFEQTK